MAHEGWEERVRVLEERINTLNKEIAQFKQEQLLDHPDLASEVRQMKGVREDANTQENEVENVT